MTLTRRDLWLAIAVLAAALLLRVAFPRYAYPFGAPHLRLDRWTGTVEQVTVRRPEPGAAGWSSDVASKVLLTVLFVETGLLVTVLGRSRSRSTRASEDNSQ